MESVYNSRKFNLVPPKTEEEKVEIEERNNSFLYSFILIFSAVVVFLFLTLAQTLVIEPRIAQNKSNLEALNSQIGTFDNLKQIHGELFVKSQSLDPIIVQDIKLTQLLDTSQELIKGIKKCAILTYSRTDSGQFSLTLYTAKITDFNQVFTNSESIKVLDNLKLQSISAQQGGGYIVKLGFFITNIINTNGQ